MLLTDPAIRNAKPGPKPIEIAVVAALLGGCVVFALRLPQTIYSVTRVSAISA